jgi:hypothetical protein
MIITQDINLNDFEFWGPAGENVTALTADQLDELTDLLTDEYPDGLTVTQLNDIFAYSFDSILAMLDLEYFQDELVTSSDIEELSSEELCDEFASEYEDELWSRCSEDFDADDFDTYPDLETYMVDEPDKVADMIFDILKNSSDVLIEDEGNGYFRLYR